MSESKKAKRFVWVLSLTFGPVACCIPLVILLLTSPRTPDIAVVTPNVVDLVEALVVSWPAGFVIVWVVYWLSKFVVKYGPFM
jgi:hypothetical protein